jgi:hypothetical protein
MFRSHKLLSEKEKAAVIFKLSKYKNTTKADVN